MYYKQISGGYLIAVGHTEATAASVTQITEEEYNEINSFLATRPVTPADYRYRPTDALTWELCELPPAPQNYTADELLSLTNVELEAILYLHGISVNMTKANMVKLVLAAQEEGAEV